MIKTNLTREEVQEQLIQSGVVLQDDGGAIVPLKKPVLWGEQRVDALKLRPIKGKDYAAPGCEMETNRGQLNLIARLADVALPLIDELELPDLLRLQMILGFWFAISLPTGKKP